MHICMYGRTITVKCYMPHSCLSRRGHKKCLLSCAKYSDSDHPAIDIYLSYHTEMKIWMCGKQITVKNWQNFPTSNPKTDLHNIKAQTKFGENAFSFIKVIILKLKYRRIVGRYVCKKKQKKNWRNMPISNPKPAKHIPNLVKIHQYFSNHPETKIRTDVWQTERHLDSQHETIIPRHCPVCVCVCVFGGGGGGGV